MAPFLKNCSTFFSFKRLFDVCKSGLSYLTHHLSRSSKQSLRYVHMAENSFSGSLQDRFNETGFLDKLQGLALNDNQFTGAIPPSLEGLDSIKAILLHHNKFDGPVPDNLCNIRKPTWLTVLQADCGGEPIANECKCCTRCCDRQTKICKTPSRRLSMRDAEEHMFGLGHHLATRERKLQPPKCTALYRWDPDAGLVEYVPSS